MFHQLSKTKLGLSLCWTLSLLTLLECHHMTKSLPKAHLCCLQHPMQLGQRLVQAIHVIVHNKWLKASYQRLQYHIGGKIVIEGKT